MGQAQQIPLDLGHRSASGREDFLVAVSNQDAVSMLDHWPNWSAPVLIISGPPASGKTHIADVWRQKTGAKIIPAELLLSRSAEDLASTGEHLLIDGVDPWLGDADADTTLFHLYNMFKEQERSFLMTMRMTPTQVDFSLPDLASRMRAAPLAVIRAPGDDLLSAIMIKLFADRQLKITDDIVQYVMPRIERSFTAIRDIVALADEKALSQKRKVSVPLMREVLADLQG